MSCHKHTPVKVNSPDNSFMIHTPEQVFKWQSDWLLCVSPLPNTWVILPSTQHLGHSSLPNTWVILPSTQHLGHFPQHNTWVILLYPTPGSFSPFKMAAWKAPCLMMGNWTFFLSFFATDCNINQVHHKMSKSFIRCPSKNECSESKPESCIKSCAIVKHTDV